MHDIFNLWFTTFSLLQNYLSRVRLISPITHYKTLFAYTLIDTFTLPGNVRAFSILIHHIAVMHLAIGAMNHLEIDCHDVCLLEITTLLNSLNRIYMNGITLQARNISWIIVRLILFPFITFDIMRQMFQLDDGMMLFTTYSFSLVSLLVLSLEWTNEVLCCNQNYISSIYFVIPTCIHMQAFNLAGVLTTCSLCALSMTKLPLINIRYEYRLLINLASSLYVTHRPTLI